MNPLILWLQLGGIEQEIIIPAQYVASIMLRAVEHEAGHIVAADYFGGTAIGIAVGFMPGRSPNEMHIHAIYGLGASSVETQCIVKSAGPAADILHHGQFEEISASGDLDDIETLSGSRSFGPYMGRADEILKQNKAAVECIADALRVSLATPKYRLIGTLPNGWSGSILVDRAQLSACLRRRGRNNMSTA